MQAELPVGVYLAATYPRCCGLCGSSTSYEEGEQTLVDLAVPLGSQLKDSSPDAELVGPVDDQRRPFNLVHAAAIIFLTAVAARWTVFGDPLVHIDEEFYLLVGSRMLHGALPYVDIWDRKPIGLFLIFSGARLLGGDGVLQYQILALLFTCATALTLFAIARRVAGAAGGLFAALLYIVYLDLAGGEAGQAPVWYNLPVAGAIAIIFFARDTDRARAGNFRWSGGQAMLLFGIALQIKYSAVFEGVFAGTALLALAGGRGRKLPLLATDAAIWIGCAVLPTLIAGSAYAALGHFHEWLYANFVSITERGAESAPMIRWRVAELTVILIPLVVAIPLRRWTSATPSAPERRDDIRFLDAWAACSLLGVVLFGTWFNHYALPTFAPLSVAAAPLMTRRAGRAYALALIVGAAFWGQHILHRHLLTRGNRALLTAVTAAVRDHRNCLFVYDGLVATYDAAQSCLPTHHVFPTHFAGLIERNATGIDQAALVADIMRRRPDRVTTMEPAYMGENLVARAILYKALQAHYVPITRIHRWDRTLVIYGLVGTVADTKAPLVIDGVGQY